MNQPLREALVDLDAIAANVALLRTTFGTEHAMVVVKANGYGHGAVPVARAVLAGGADSLGVVDIVEALELREAGITAPILAWLHAHDQDFRVAVDADLDIGVASNDQLERAAAAGVARVHVKVDTGLGRNGATEADWPALFERAAAIQRGGVTRVRGIFSHLANTGEREDADQIASFERALAVAASVGVEPELRHLAATAGALRRPHARFNMVRFGVGSYGLSPFRDATSADLGIRPALQVSAEVVLVKRVPAGSTVSYNYHYRTAAETTLALVPLGYADGVPRAASGVGPVVINGTRFQVAGAIAMDQFVVDVGDTPVVPGDRAVLFGDPEHGYPSLDEWAVAADTINYQISTALGRRVQRRYIGGE